MNPNDIDQLLRGAKGSPPPDATKEKIMSAANAALNEHMLSTPQTGRRVTPVRAKKIAAAKDSVWRRLGALNVAALLMLAVMGGYFAHYYLTKVYWPNQAETARSGETHQLFDATEPPATPEEKARIAELLTKLDSDNFDTREQALQALIALGPKALPQLQAAQGKDADTKALLQKAIRQIEHNHAVGVMEKRWPGMAKQYVAHKCANPFDNPPPGPTPDAWFKTQDKRELAPVLVELFPLLMPGNELDFVEYALNRLAYPFDQGILDWSFIEVRGAKPVEVLERPDSGFEQTVSPKAREIIAAKLKAGTRETEMVVLGGPAIFKKDLNALGVRLVLTAKPSRLYFLQSEAAVYWREWLAAQQKRLDWQPGDSAAVTAENVNKWAASLADEHDAPLAMQRLIGAWANPETQAALKKNTTPRNAKAAQTLKRLETLVQARAGRLLAMENSRPVTMNPDGTDMKPLFKGESAKVNWGSQGIHFGLWYFTMYGGGPMDGLYQWSPGMDAPRKITSKMPRRTQWLESKRQVWCLENEQDASLIIIDQQGALLPVPEPLKVKFVDYEISPDGRLVACVQRINNELKFSIFDLASGQFKPQQKSVAADESTLGHASWSASGSYALFTVSRTRADIYVATQLWLYESKTGSLRDVFQAEWVATMTEWAGDSLALMGTPFNTKQMLFVPPPFSAAKSVPFPAGVVGEWLDISDGVKLNGLYAFNEKTMRFDDRQVAGLNPQPVKIGAETWTVYANANAAGLRQIEWRAPDGTTLPVTAHTNGVEFIRYADSNWTGWKK